MTIFQQRVYNVVKRIPKGKVATYRSIAVMVGTPNASRAVGNALHKNPDHNHIPCHRVVNHLGECSGSFAFGGKNTQEKLLVKEGVKFYKGRVLKEFFMRYTK